MAMAWIFASTGCSFPSAVPSDLQLPSLVSRELPNAQRAIVKYGKGRNGRLPQDSLGEQIAHRAVKQRSQTVEEVDAGGNRVSILETIDGVGYNFRPARETFVLVFAGHVTQTPIGGGASSCTWFKFEGRYGSRGEVLVDDTSYLENADLFEDAMRSTSNKADWNTSAWAISRINIAITNASGAAVADAMVSGFINGAIASGLARVPTDMTPRQAAFGGIDGVTANPPSAK